MNTKIILFLLLMIGLILVGCTKDNDYSSYNQPAQQPANQYIGGACGVAAPDHNTIPNILKAENL